MICSARWRIPDQEAFVAGARDYGKYCAQDGRFVRGSQLREGRGRMDLIDRLLGKTIRVIQFSDDQLNIDLGDGVFMNIFSKTSYRILSKQDGLGVITRINRSTDSVTIDITEDRFIEIDLTDTQNCHPEAFLVKFPDVTYVDRGISE